MANGSTRAVLVALAGDLFLALAKFAAAIVSRSTAMLTAAIYQLVDSSDEVLLLVGQRRGEMPPDALHPLGHGMETYFWAFIVAVMVFLMGGALSVYEGVESLRHPSPLGSPWINLAVLAVSAGFEGASFRIGYLESKRVVRGHEFQLWDFIKGSKDPNLVSILLGGPAALIGIMLAAAAVVAGTFLHVTWADGAASVLIGAILAGVAFVLANEIRSLIAGEAVAPIVLEKMRETLALVDCITVIEEIATLHLGPGAILVGLTLAFRRDSTTEMLAAAVREITNVLQNMDGRIAYVYVRPSPRETE
jgi:cation diffusion facilitator family transporter